MGKPPNWLTPTVGSPQGGLKKEGERERLVIKNFV